MGGLLLLFLPGQDKTFFFSNLEKKRKKSEMWKYNENRQVQISVCPEVAAGNGRERPKERERERVVGGIVGWRTIFWIFFFFWSCCCKLEKEKEKRRRQKMYLYIYMNDRNRLRRPTDEKRGDSDAPPFRPPFLWSYAALEAPRFSPFLLSSNSKNVSVSFPPIQPLILCLCLW